MKLVLPIQLRGPTGTILDLNAIIDTGFNDALTLSHSIISALNLSFAEKIAFSLADGSGDLAKTFQVEVFWLGEWRRILALELENEPLIGMTLLDGTSLRIDAVAGGRVEIRPLP